MKNIAKFLYDNWDLTSKHTFWSPLCGECKVEGEFDGDNYTIMIRSSAGGSWRINAEGKLSPLGDLLVFPNRNDGFDSWDELITHWERFGDVDGDNFKPFDKVVYREVKDGRWLPGFFACKVGDDTFVIGSEYNVVDCLPFNEKTEKLIGTCKS